MNEYSVVDMIVNTASSPSLTVVVFGILSACCFAALFATKVGQFLLPKPTETRVIDFLPFARLDDDGATIYCKNGSISRVYELTGTDTVLILPEERDALMEMRKRWVDSLSEVDVYCRIFTARQFMSLTQQETHKNEVLRQVSEAWIENLDRVYHNKHYVVLTVNDRKNALEDLDLAQGALLSSLSAYHPVLISEKTPDNHEDKSPFWLFANICSPLSRPQPLIASEKGDALNSLLTVDSIHFTGEKGIIRFFAGDREKLCCVMGIRRCGDYMDEQMAADILSIDVELTIAYNIRPIPHGKATAYLMQQQRQAMFTSPSPGVHEQYDIALSMLDASDENAQTLNDFAMTIYIYGSSREELQFGQEEIEKICRNYNVSPVRESWVAQPSFFAQFPTYDIYPKNYVYFSRVVGCAFGFDKIAEGLPKSDWGQGPISYFKTVMGTAYQFQFHISSDAYAVAHTALIGPTGGGKTTLFSFLAGQAMRHNDLNVYFFDRNKGAKVFALMIDSPYIRFDGGEGATTLNPFATPDSPDNRAFLRTWLRDITGATDPMSEQEIARAVTTAFDYLRPEERLLKNLYKSCFSAPSVNNPGKMRSELFRWINDEQYGRIFNAPVDNLDMGINQYMAFDFTNIFADPILAPAVISYIMHRIQTSSTLRATPALIMIDETAPMLEHPMFKESFIVGLREGRKKRQAYLCAFQEPTFLERKGLGDVIRGQCQTQIFFRNSQASSQDYAGWNLSPREMAFVLDKDFTGSKYAILVKRSASHESVILDVNLGGLGPLLKIYSSGSKDVKLAEELREQIKDQKEFVSTFLKKAI